jgi:2-aminoadipate transaminase
MTLTDRFGRSTDAAIAAAGRPPRFWRVAPAAAAVQVSAIREILKVTEVPGVWSFAGGLPNPATFPVEPVRAASAQILRDDPVGALQYGPTEGYTPLREQIAARLSAAGEATTIDNVLVTTGSQQALDLIGKALLVAGAKVLAANPSYVGALQAFALHRPRLQRIDDDSAIDHAAFAYATPNFANPTGATLSAEARRDLLDRLAARGVPLIEDDAYGELWFDAAPPRACRALAPEQTLALGSFSKVLAPGLRVGYVVGPPPLISQLARLKQAADLHTPSLNQRLVAALIADGTLDAQLPRLRAFYKRQRDVLLAALRRHLAAFADWQTPEGGMFAWLRLKGGRDATPLLAAALRRGIAFVPGAPFYFDAVDPATLRLSFSTVPAERIDEGIARLAEACAANPSV